MFAPFATAETAPVAPVAAAIVICPAEPDVIVTFDPAIIYDVPSVSCVKDPVKPL